MKARAADVITTSTSAPTGACTRREMSWTTLNAAMEPLINTRTRSGRSVEGDIVDQPCLAQERGDVTA